MATGGDVVNHLADGDQKMESLWAPCDVRREALKNKSRWPGMIYN